MSFVVSDQRDRTDGEAGLGQKDLLSVFSGPGLVPAAGPVSSAGFLLGKHELLGWLESCVIPSTDSLLPRLPLHGVNFGSFRRVFLPCA